LDFARDLNSLAKSNDEFCGTSSYMSPQMVHQDPYTSKTDIWSFGCIVYELLTLRKAFYGKTVFDTMDSIMKNKPKPIDSADAPEFDFIINK
jgi:NIMA (never in mitosis gene a)-related kinase